MKRFFTFLFVLAIALGVLYFWWQRNATQVITKQVRSQAKGFVVNPENLDIENSAVILRSLRDAHVDKLTISGHDLVVNDGPTLQAVKIVVKDIDVSGPPFHFTKVGSGDFSATVSESSVTEFLRRKGVRIAANVRIPLNSLSVAFQPGNRTLLRGTVRIPLVNREVSLTATGALVPSSQFGQVDFRASKIDIPFGGKEVASALQHINPVVDLTEWPVTCEVTAITTGQGTATMRGRVVDVTSKLLP